MMKKSIGFGCGLLLMAAAMPGAVEAVKDKYYIRDLSTKYREAEAFKFDQPAEMYGFFTTSHLSITRSSTLPSTIQMSGSRLTFTEKGGVVIQNPLAGNPFYKIEVILEDANQWQLTAFLTSLDALWRNGVTTRGVSVGIDTASSKESYWLSHTDFKTAAQLPADQFNFSQQAQSKFLRRRLGDIKIEIVVTPSGTHTIVQGFNYSSLPPLYTGAYAFATKPINYLVLGKWNTGGDKVVFKDLKIIDLDESVSGLDEINAFFIKRTVEGEAFRKIVGFDNAKLAKEIPVQALLWMPYLYRAYDYYFRTNHETEVRRLADLYLQHLPGYLDSQLNRYGRDTVTGVTHTFINSFFPNPYLVYAINDYLTEAQRESIRIQLARVIDKSMEYILKDGCTPINMTAEAPTYSLNDCFPAGIWYKNDTFAEETGWLKGLYAGYLAAFPIDKERIPKLVDYLNFLGFHNLTTGINGHEGSSIREVYGTGFNFKVLGGKYLDFVSQYIWNDGTLDNHDYHPSINYAFGQVGEAAENLLAKNGYTLPLLSRNAGLVYQKSIISNYDPATFRLNKFLPNPGTMDEYAYAADGTARYVFGRTEPSRMEDWATDWPYYHVFENYGDYAMSDQVALRTYRTYYTNGGRFGCSHSEPVRDPGISKCEPYAWQTANFNNLRGTGTDETYLSYSTFIYTTAAGQKTRQSFVSGDGRTKWHRDCGQTPEGQLSCTGAVWVSTNLTNLRGVGNETYQGYNVFVFTKNGVETIFENYLETGGKNVWYRSCDRASTTWPTCQGAFNKTDLTNLRGQGNESYRSYSAYIFQGTDGKKLRQNFLSGDGLTLWSRTCPVNETGLLSCTGVKFTKEDFSDVSPVGTAVPIAFDGYIFRRNGEDHFRSNILMTDKRTVYYRNCHLIGQNCQVDNRTWMEKLAANQYGQALWAMLFSDRSGFDPRYFYPQDVDKSGRIEKNDFLKVLAGYNLTCSGCDLAADGRINALDMAAVVEKIPE